MGRNEERIGAVSDDNPITALPMSQNENSSFNLIMPTELVELPSKGKYYPDGHPLKDKEACEIRFLGAKEEDILNNKSFIKKGIVIDKMLQSIVVDKNIKVEDVLIGDRNALVVAARITGFSEKYETKITCPSCEESIDFSFDLSTQKMIEGDPTMLQEDGSILLPQLPKSRATVKCRLLTGKDEQYMTTLAEGKKKNHLQETPITDFIKMIVVSVNGNQDKLAVSQFISALPMVDSRFIRAEYKKAIPNIDLTQVFTCSECGASHEMEVPFGVTFFWPK